MPELPEVEITRRGIEPHIADRCVTAVSVRQPRLRYPVPADLAEHLLGQRLLAVRRRAKYLLLDFAQGSVIVHLGMSGSLRVLPVDTPPQTHDHVDIAFGEKLLRLRDPRRFGAVLWAAGGQAPALLDHLGVEPLSEDFNGNWLYTATRDRRTAIKLFIMDAHRVVGVGNIYASESLFRARINPHCEAGRLSRKRCELLAQCIRETLNDALAAGGSSLRDFVHSDGASGYFQQQYYAYSREGEDCRVCGGVVRREIMGQRATFWCVRCQKR